MRLAASTQQPVARQVAEAVVDELELVDVEEQHRDLAVGSLGARERVIEAIDEERAVRQSREGIGQGLAYRVGCSRRGERHARVLGEEPERVGVRLAELAMVLGRDHQAADDLAVTVHGAAMAARRPFAASILMSPSPAAVGVRDQQSLLDDRPAADTLVTGPRRSTRAERSSTPVLAASTT